MAWLTGWSYAKDISLTGQSGAGTLYQVELDIGASAGGDFHLEGHCTNFPQDIEVTDNDGTTLLDFFIEDITSDPIKLQVEVTDDLGSNQSIRVYYGKSGATTNSDIVETSLLGDDFSGASLDTGKWNSAGTPAQTGGEIICTGTSGERIYSITSFQYKKFRSRGKLTWGGGSYAAQLGFSATYAGEGTNALQFYVQSTTDTRVLSGDAAASEITSIGDFDGAYHTWEIRWKNGEAKYYVDDVLKDTDTTHVPSASIPVFFESYHAAAESRGDWVFIAKYNDPEPAFSSAGAEQSAPVVGAIMNQFQKANMGADLYNGAIIA